jgi:DnaJ-class molecular chaperone
LVPLWHNELYFDSPEGDIIVICNPELPANILLDEDNNIYVEKEINFSTELLDLIKNNGFVSLTIGENSFSIPVSQLYMKKDQIYKMKGQGISQVLENDIYNVSCKSNIIVKIRIIY